MIEIVAAGIEALLTSWAETKFALEQSLPFDADWVHVVIGPVLLLLAAVILRRPISSWVPWSVVAILAALNELIDLVMEESPGQSIPHGENLTDFLLTILIPTVMLLIARLSRLAPRRPSVRQSD